MYVNVGVTINCRFADTKKALREALRDDPDSVRFFRTSPLGLGGADTPYAFAPEDIQPGWTLSVVGPDPDRNRRWYATVVRENDKVHIE